MGTRGFIGFVVDGTEKIVYNHFDSYPSGLGVEVLSWLRDEVVEVNEVRELASALRVVTDNDIPSPEDIDRLKAYYNPGVGRPAESPTWYQLLRETQGNPGAILEAGVIEDASGFPADSLFAEWGYVVDLDEYRFEVYEGFQQSPHTKGRFASSSRQHSSYYPVALVGYWPLDSLPTDAEFIATVDPVEDEG